MKRILLIISLLLSASPSLAEDIRGAGSTSQCFDLFVSDSSSSVGAGLTALAYNTGSLTCYYFRNESGTGETATSITLASSTLGTYTSGAFKEISAANMPGHYEFCPPDAALATGASAVTFQCKGAANMAPANLRVLLSPSMNVASASADSIPDSAFTAQGTAQSVTSSTIQLASSESYGDDELNYNTEVCIASASTGGGQCRCVIDTVATTDTLTITPNWQTTPTGTIKYKLRASGACQMFNTAVAKYNFMNDAGVALSACPSATATKKEQLQYLFEALINRSTQTSTTRTLRNAGNSGNLCTETITPGATFVKGQAS